MVCRNCDKVSTEGKGECESQKLRYVGLLVHDLRRTSVRNFRRLGFAEKTIMEISGHKTAHIFRLYDIVDESDFGSGSGSAGQEASVTVESQFRP